MSCEFVDNIFSHVQHVGSAVIKLESPLCDGQLLGSADQQTGIQLLFQSLYMGTDGGLGKVQLAGSFRKAFIFYYSYKCF